MFSDVGRSFFRQPVADSAPNSERAKAPSASGHTLVADGKKRRSWRTFVARGALVVLLIATGGGLWLHWKLSASLPQLDGEVAVEGLADAVQITRDANGNPAIEASSRADLAFGVGFAHAQDRLFQMDAMRRVSSGRLCELLGEAAFPADRHHRKHRFQQLAKKVVANSTEEQKRLLTSYSAGVNAGIAKMKALPFEYLVLNAKPDPWQVEDCVFVLLTMFCEVQDEDGGRERGLGTLHENVPEEVFRFMVRTGSSWDAALDESTIPQPPLPSGAVWSLRSPASDERGTADLSSPHQPTPEWTPPGKGASNNWAVSGRFTDTGHAMLASDMHLKLGMPSIWYRLSMNWTDESGSKRRAVGVTLPGTPNLVEGSNGSIAWGFTTSFCDVGDVIELQMDDTEPDSYRTPDGLKKLERFTEEVPIGGAKTKRIENEWSIWGPVVENRDGRRFVSRWIGHDFEAVNFNLFALETANTAEESLLLANQLGIPPMNFVVADSAGSIGWTVAGRLPRRTGLAPMVPVDWSEANAAWSGYLSAPEYPRILNPSSGKIWTANSRVVGGEMLETLGDGGYFHGARAKQIRARLNEKDRFTEADMLAIQLDNEAIFLARWQQLLIRVIDNQPELGSSKMRDFVENWGGRASVDSIGYSIVREFRVQVIDYLFGVASSRVGLGKDQSRVAQGAFPAKTGVTANTPYAYEDVTWDILEAQPENLLPPEFQSWDEFLSKMVRSTEKYITNKSSLADASWGSQNTVTIDHPMSASLPFLSSFLNMPKTPLPGDEYMPLVQAKDYGATQRLVVTPGHEENGIYHQAGGPSGNPYSPFYRTGFEDWTGGRVSPLLPGKTVHRLTLKPSNLVEASN